MSTLALKDNEEFKIINRSEISIEELKSLQKEYTYKQICESYKISNETLLKICDKLGLKFRKTKKKIIDVSTIADIIYDEVTL